MDQSQSPRPALASVSPNIKLAASAPAFMKKTITGSPLKRTFTAAIEDNGGLLYLKRRRLGEHEVLSEMSGKLSHPGKELLLDTDASNAALPPTEPSPSPTEPDTSSEDEAAPSSSAERRSFSSLINYDPSSQISNPASSAPSSAELLRLRLRVAMYKVRTNQIQSSFDDLKDEKQCQELARRKAIDDAVAELRQEAQDVLARTPYTSSSDSAAPPTSPPRTQLNDIVVRWPGSFLAAESPEKSLLPTHAGTPLRALWDTSTPPNTGGRLSRVLEPELTSSVVKGRVAEGLLGLRNAL